MNSRLQAKLNDTPLLNLYLRHAEFAPEDCHYDTESQIFTLDLSRICFEQGERGKSLFFFHVMRYPRISSRLTITSVHNVAEHWMDEKFNVPNLVHVLNTIERENASMLMIASEHLSLRLMITWQTEFILHDSSTPNVKRLFTYYSRGKDYFPKLDEVNKLRESAPQI